MMCCSDRILCISEASCQVVIRGLNKVRDDAAGSRERIAFEPNPRIGDLPESTLQMFLQF